MDEFPESTYTGVVVYKKSHIYLSSVSDELAEQDIDHAAILRWRDGAWDFATVDMAVCGMCVVDGEGHRLLNLGVEGTVVIFTFPGEQTEHIDLSEEGPSDLVNLRALRKIDGLVYAAGMARLVYRRPREGVWEPIHQDLFVPSGERVEAVGLNALDGFNGQEIYAAGFNGEIWYYNGAAWKETVSPTNLVLNCVLCASDGYVYVAGMAGIVLRGRGDRWAVIADGSEPGDFWGIAEFNSNIWLASEKGVFRVEGGDLAQIDMGFEKAISTAYLDSGDGILCSVGNKDVAITEDGGWWTRIPKPWP